MADPMNPKRKNRSPLRVIVNAGGCLLAAVMLVIGGLAGIGGALFVAPGIFGFNVTATALAEDGILLAATAADLDQRAMDASASETAFVRDGLATRAALNNEGALLAQTATRSAGNIFATATANAVANARQRTQIALDATATQAALQRNATQVEIDFRNTQAALDGADGASVPAQEAQAQVVVTQAATATPLPPPSDTPTVTATARPESVRYGFATGFDGAWETSATDDWVFQQDGVRAVRDGWLRLNDSGVANQPQRITWEITPVAVPEAVYWLLFGLDDSGGYAAAIRSDNLVAVEIMLYRFPDAAWDDNVLTSDEMTRISRSLSNSSLSSPTEFSLVLRDDTAQVRVNDNPVLASDGIMADGNGIGAYLPAGVILRTVAVDSE